MARGDASGRRSGSGQGRIGRIGRIGWIGWIGWIGRIGPLALAALVALVAPAVTTLPPLVASALARESGHVLVVHAPHGADPRYARMRLQYSAIEAVWRGAGVAFVGLVPGAPPEVMGALPPGLSPRSLARAAPPAAGFGTRLVAASGRIVHAADAEVPRAVLLALVEMGGGAGDAGAGSAPPSPVGTSGARANDTIRASDQAPANQRSVAAGAPSADDPLPLAGPHPARRPAVGERDVAAARAMPVPPAPPVPPVPPASGARTALDWDSARRAEGGTPSEATGTATVGTVPNDAASGARTALARPDAGHAPASGDDAMKASRPAIPGTGGTGPARRAVHAVGPAPVAPPRDDARPAAPARRRAAWNLWSGAGSTPPARIDAGGPAVSTAAHAATGTEAASARTAFAGTQPTGSVPPTPTAVAPSVPLDALDPAIPPAAIARARAEVVADRLAEARRHDGFESALMDAALPVGVQARMRFREPPSRALLGVDAGLALLVTGSCGAAVPPPPAPRRRSWFGLGG